MTLDVSSLFSVKGKTVLVTGASGYLGRTFVETLLTNGARVCAWGCSERIVSIAEDWKERFGDEMVACDRVDMCQPKQLATALRRLLDSTGRIDAMVNNAHELGPRTGFNTAKGSLEQTGLEEIDRNIASGIDGPFQVIQAIGEGMKDGGGSIVNVSTMYALVAPDPQLYEGKPFGNPPGYSIAKAGMLALTRYVASYWGRFGIRCNAIIPGPFPNIETPGANSVDEKDEFLDRLDRKTCLGRTGRPDELAGALLYLISDASSYVTGQSIVVDGGWTTR